MPIDNLLKVYERMRESLRQFNKARNASVEPVVEQMATIESAIIDQLLTDEDMRSLVFFYNIGRDELDAIDDQFKKEKGHILLRQEKLEAAIFNLLRKTNSESIKTECGTAFTTTQTSVKIADWKVFLGEVVKDALSKALGTEISDETLQAVLSQESWSLIKRAASKDAVKAAIEETKKPVPGVDFDQWLQVSVRRK